MSEPPAIAPTCRSAPADAPAEPTAVRHEGTSVAYWREGEMAYAVTGGGAPEAIDGVAEGDVQNRCLIEAVGGRC